MRKSEKNPDYVPSTLQISLPAVPKRLWVQSSAHCLVLSCLSTRCSVCLEYPLMPGMRVLQRNGIYSERPSLASAARLRCSLQAVKFSGHFFIILFVTMGVVRCSHVCLSAIPASASHINTYFLTLLTLGIQWCTAQSSCYAQGASSLM